MRDKAVHPNKAFRTTSQTENLSFARNRGFGVLSINGEDGPLASHIPFILSKDGTSFGSHLVISNPIIGMLSEELPAVMIVSGPDAYISPDWYDTQDQVPTWNYVAVHLRGSLKRLPEEQLLPHLNDLSAQFEERLAPKPVWTIDKVAPQALAKLTKMIVPVEFNITSIDGTWKLGQNKAAEAQRGAANGLQNSEIGQMIQELSDLMR